MRNYSCLLILTVLVFFLGACGSGIQIKDKEWKLHQVEKPDSGDKKQVNEAISLEFGEDNFIVNLTENDCDGKYMIRSDDMIDIAMYSCTKSCCDSELSDAFLVDFLDGLYFSFAGDELVLSNNKTKYYFK